MSFGDGGSENVEGCGFACSVGTDQDVEQAKFKVALGDRLVAAQL